MINFYNISELIEAEKSIYNKFVQFIFDKINLEILSMDSCLYIETVKKKIGKEKVSVDERCIVGSIKLKNNYDIIYCIYTDDNMFNYTLWKNNKCILSTSDNMDKVSFNIHSTIKNYKL